MRKFEPLGKEHRQTFMIDGHYIEKVWKRVSWDMFRFDAVFDKCEEMEQSRRRTLRYIWEGL